MISFKIKKHSLLFLALQPVLLLLCFSNNVFADTRSDLLKKTEAQGIYRCYKYGGAKKSVSDAEVTGTTKMVNLVFPSLSDKTAPYPQIYRKSDIGDNPRFNKNQLSCDALAERMLGGDADAKGDQRKTVMTNLGFKAPASASGTPNNSCIQFTYVPSIKFGNTFSPDSPSGYFGGRLPEETSSSICMEYDTSKKITKVSLKNNGSLNSLISLDATKGEISGKGLKSKVSYTLNSTTKDTLIQGLTAQAKAASYHDFAKLADGTNETVLWAYSKYDTDESGDGSGTSQYTWKDSDAGKTAMVPISKYYGFSNFSSMTLSDSEKIWLYQSYLVDYYGASVIDVPENDTEASAKKGEGYEEIWWVDSNGGRTRLIKGGSDAKVYSVNDDKVISTNQIGYADVIAELNKAKLDKFSGISDDLSRFDNPTGSTPVTPGSTSDETSEKTCLSEAGPMGWLLCPAAEGGAATVDGIYSYLEGKLTLDARFFSNSSGSRTAWGNFIGVANIILIIVLLIIIFSQLTGVGIDNYGIKKILPRLIIGILLVEASFIISQIGIDLSNILGSSFARSFQAIADGIDKNGTSAYLTFTAIFDGLLGIVGVAGAAAPTAIAVAAAVPGGPAAVLLILLPLLLSILAALVAVLMFFLMIGLRSIIAIVCVAVSPIALACYILPNTQKVFKLWFNAFKATLIVYPLCSLIYGGGKLAKAIMAADATAAAGTGGITWSMATIAALVPFLPFLVAPSLLRSSLRSLGELGAKLQGLQRSATGAIGSAKRNVKDSDKYKDTVDTANYQRANKLAARYTNKAADFTAKANSATTEKEKNRYKRKAGRLGRMAGFQMGKALAYEKRQSDAMGLSTEEAQEAARQSIENAAYSKRIDDSLSAMELGGITYNDGSHKEYGVLNMRDRLQELAETDTEGWDDSRMDKYNLEVATLARGLSNERGGSSKIASILRGSKTKRGFLDSMATNVYSKDANVRAGLNKKDVGASQYLEQFRGGGKFYDKKDYDSFSKFSRGIDYANLTGKNGIKKNLIEGIDQGEAARKEYLASLSETDFADLAQNDEFYKLDNDVTDAVRREYARRHAYHESGRMLDNDAWLKNSDGSYVEKTVVGEDGRMRKVRELNPGYFDQQLRIMKVKNT